MAKKGKEDTLEIEKVDESKEKLKKSIALVTSQLKKKFGSDILFKMNERKSSVQKIKFGPRSLDRITDGGAPRGRLTQIGGPPKAGKTTLAYCLLAEIQREFPDDPEALFVDMEKTYDEARAVEMGCNPEHIIVAQPDNAETAFEIMRAYAPTGIAAIVVDSIPYLYPDKVMEGDVGHQDVAPIARFLNVEIPKFVPMITRHNVALVMINQVRDNVGMLGWGDPTHFPGGKQLQHASSLIIKMARKGAIKVSDDILGQEVKVKVEASKVCAPHKECILNLIFDKGYIEDENLEMVKKIVRKEHIRLAKLDAEHQLALTVAAKKADGEVDWADDEDDG